jgi:C-terminal processing protease CtpA/Prc
VDGRTVQDLLEAEQFPYIFASTSQGRNLEAYPRLLDGTPDSTAELTIRSLDGATRQVQLKRTLRGAPASWGCAWAERGRHEAGWIGNQIYYFPIDSFSSQEVVDQFVRSFDEISKADGLALDVRNNTGGNDGFALTIISYLTDKPLQASHWKTRQYMPAFRAWGEKEKWYEAPADVVEPVKDRKPFIGPIVLLIGPKTFSAGEDFLIPLHASKRATLIGQPTGGSTGMPLQIELPHGAGMRICTKRDTYPDGREFVGVGFIPDVKVEPTQADVAAGRYANGNDPVFDKGVEVLKTAIAQAQR